MQYTQYAIRNTRYDMFIIDGHNLLHAIQKMHEEFDSITGVQLCRIVGRYLKLIGDKGEIVFDGTGPRDTTEFDSIANLDVFFAGLSVDADSVIEDKIKANTAPKRLTVVSSDRKLCDAARRRKAAAIKSKAFWDNLQKQLSRKRAPREPHAKRAGLSEGETDQWLKFFGIED